MIAKYLFLSLPQYKKDPNEMTDDPMLPMLNCVDTRLRTYSEEQKTKKIAVLKCASAQPRAPREPRRLAGLPPPPHKAYRSLVIFHESVNLDRG